MPRVNLPRSVLSVVIIDTSSAVDQDGQNPANALLVGVTMSLCWSNATDENNLPLKLRLFLALDDFLFEEIPHCADLLTVWAIAGAVWLFWLAWQLQQH